MILTEIAKKTMERVEYLKTIKPLEDMKKEAMSQKINDEFIFKKALSTKELSFICEVKKASPSKGVIAKEFPYIEIAKEYEEAGAAAISVLTEPYYFMGQNQYLSEISQNVTIPIIRKDFTVDEYMIYEAKVIGADAILLICSILTTQQIEYYIKIAESIGLSVLVEAHDEKEIEMALTAGADIIGVNNRDLNTFQVDIENSIRLRNLVPDSIIYVSESGIKTKEDIEKLENNGTDAVLIGETFMTSTDKRKVLRELRGL